MMQSSWSGWACNSVGLVQWHPTPVLSPGKSHGRRSLVGCSPWDRWESGTTERLHFHFSLSCIGEGNGNPLQCSCLENPGDGGAWWAAVYGVTQSLGREGPLEKEMAAHSHILPGEFHGQRSLMVYNPWVSKNQTRLSHVHECPHAKGASGHSHAYRQDARWRGGRRWSVASTKNTKDCQQNLGSWGSGNEQYLPWHSEEPAPPTEDPPPLGCDTAHFCGLSHLVCAPLIQCPCKWYSPHTKDPQIMVLELIEGVCLPDISFWRIQSVQLPHRTTFYYQTGWLLPPSTIREPHVR